VRAISKGSEADLTDLEEFKAMGRGGARLGAGRPKKPRWVADISAVRADRQAPALTETEEARLVDIRAAYDNSVKTLERLRAQPSPSLMLLRSIRQETATLMQLSLLLSKLEERQPPAAVDVPVSKWAGVI
jgi:hypothetical protein